MKNLYDNILDISHNYYEYLMNLENVMGVGLGLKEINGVKTFEPSIHVLVENKVDSKYLTSNNIIPKNYMGIKTDVIKVKKSKIRSSEQFVTQKFRPLEGGCGISPNAKVQGIHIPNGTLGCIVTKLIDDKREFFILSNAHVLAGLNDFQIGTSIFQPSNINGGDVKNDTIAHLTSYIPLKFIEGGNKPINYVDAGIAKLISDKLASDVLFDIGKINGTTKPKLGLEIQKVGFVTGLSFGEIKTMGISTEVEYDDGVDAFFKDLILSDNLDNDSGDSGAVVVDNSNKVLGLFMSGVDSYAFFSDIQRVLDDLKIEIYTG